MPNESKPELRDFNRPSNPDDESPATADLHPSIQHVLQYFTTEHLPPRLQAFADPFANLAIQVAIRNPSSPETTVALQKLLEAKDAAVRAGLDVK